MLTAAYTDDSLVYVSSSHFSLLPQNQCIYLCSSVFRGLLLKQLTVTCPKVEQRWPGPGRRGNGEFMLSGYKVYVWNDGEGWEMDVGDGYSIVNILLTSTLKNDCNGKFYVFLFYCNTKSTHPIPTSVSTPQTY